jgi:lactate dehydrogenase-like 2-hydroxyacid dehydrogenase
MKAVVFSVKNFEKVFLARANSKKHDITLISNPLSFETAVYARGKEAVIVFTSDNVSANMTRIFAGYGVKYIITRSLTMDHIDIAAATHYGIKLANIPDYPHRDKRRPAFGLPNDSFFSNADLQWIADQTIHNLDMWNHSVKI